MYSNLASTYHKLPNVSASLIREYKPHYMLWSALKGVALAPLKAIVGPFVTINRPISKNGDGEGKKLYTMCDEISAHIGYSLPKDGIRMGFGNNTGMAAMTSYKGGAIYIFPGFLYSKERLGVVHPWFGKPSYDLTLSFDPADQDRRKAWVEEYEKFMLTNFCTTSELPSLFRSKLEVDYRRAMYDKMIDYYLEPDLYDEIRKGVLAHEMCHLKYRDSIVVPLQTSVMSALSLAFCPYPYLSILPIYLIERWRSRYIEYRCDLEAVKAVGKTGLVRLFTDLEQVNKQVISKYPELDELKVNKELLHLVSSHPPTRERIDAIERAMKK